MCLLGIRLVPACRPPNHHHRSYLSPRVRGAARQSPNLLPRVLFNAMHAAVGGRLVHFRTSSSPCPPAARHPALAAAHNGVLEAWQSCPRGRLLVGTPRHGAGLLPCFRLHVPVDRCQYYREHGVPVSWPDMNLPHGRHLNPNRIPVPVVSAAGRARLAKTHCRRPQLPSDLLRDPTYAVESPNWDT